MTYTIDNDPRFSLKMCEISDIRELTAFEGTPAGVRIMVAADVKMPVGVFRSDEETEAWPGIA